MEDTEYTFETFDKFGRKQFSDRLTSVITTFYPFYDEAYVLSLNARYGAGKTTFLKMWANQLKASGYHVVYINAWETDFDDAPLVPIVSSLMDSLGTGNAVKKLKDALRTTLGAAVLATNDIISHATGLNIQGVAQGVEDDAKKLDLTKLGEEIYTEYSFKKRAYETLKKELANFIGKQEIKPVIILVDELDRARPDYSVKFLEAIKHIFSLPGFCFVLAVDRKQLAASVKQLYGEIDFENYYRRFITREAQLPELITTDLMPFISVLSSEFFDEKRANGVNFPIKAQDQQTIMRFAAEVCRAFRFAPRQMISLFRIFSQFLAITTKSEKTVRKAWVEASLILIAIFIDNRSLYEQVGKGTVLVDDLYNYIMNLNFPDPRSSYERYILLTSLAFAMKDEPGDQLDRLADLCIAYDGRPVTEEDVSEKRREIIGQLSRSIDEWNSISSKSSFQNIYSLLEEWRTFIE